MGAALVLSGISTAVFAILFIIFHDYQIYRPLEITFLGLSIISFLIFEYLLHK